MPGRTSRFRLVDLVFLVAAVAWLAGFLRSMGNARLGVNPAPMLLFFCMSGGLLAGFWKNSRVKRVGPPCSECGRPFVAPNEPKGPPLCPRCRRRAIGPGVARRDRKRNLWALLVVFVGSSLLFGQILDGPGGLDGGLARLLGGVGIAFGFLAILIGPFLVQSIARNRRMRDDDHVLARARTVAKTSGLESELGPIRLWASGPEDPSALVVEQAGLGRRRFEAIVGEPVPALPPLRMLVFDRRDDLAEFFYQAATDLWNLDAVFLAWLMAMTTEVVPYRLGDPARSARSLGAFHAMLRMKGKLPPYWLRTGVATVALADEGESDRSHRKMLAAIARGEASGPEMFAMPDRSISRLLNGWYDHAGFVRLSRLNWQSRSIVDYLAGPGAPDLRRRQFRAFFKEVGPARDIEAAFRLHFGHGFAELIESWRDWVTTRPPAPHASPPAEVAHALTTRLVPIVADHHAKPMDRVHAIREMARAGWALGADTLIEQLILPGPIERREVVFALESISGLALGEDETAWCDWWGTVPPEAKSPTTLVGPALADHPAGDGQQ